jgi:hypothetical protein
VGVGNPLLDPSQFWGLYSPPLHFSISKTLLLYTKKKKKKKKEEVFKFGIAQGNFNKLTELSRN